MTNPEDLRKEFERSHRRFRRIVVLVALAGLAVLIPTARPAWQTLKNWRASQFLKQAEDLLADQQVAL
ncbi:MAG: hypothetical protein L6Q38_13560, partial [Nitrospira sp.]|nr:hypothetical protein [Nitrospira sp.]